MLDILCGIGRIVLRLSLAAAFILSLLAPLFAMAGIPVDKIPVINLAEMLSNTKLYLLSWQVVNNPASLLDPTLLQDMFKFVSLSFALTSTTFMISILYLLYMLVGPVAFVVAPFFLLFQISMIIYILSQFTNRIRCA